MCKNSDHSQRAYLSACLKHLKQYKVTVATQQYSFWRKYDPDFLARLLRDQFYVKYDPQIKRFASAYSSQWSWNDEIRLGFNSYSFFLTWGTPVCLADST